MQRVTITLTDDLAAELDRFMAESRAQNRSEAIRDLVRRALVTRPDAPPEAACLGVMSFTVDQSIRNLGARLSQRRLDEHDRTLAALSVPLDHTTSLEIEVARGTVRSVTKAAEAQFLERGVAHGSLALIPVGLSEAVHCHEDGSGAAHGHTKVQPSFALPSAVPEQGHDYGHFHPHPHPHPADTAPDRAPFAPGRAPKG